MSQIVPDRDYWIGRFMCAHPTLTRMLAPIALPTERIHAILRDLYHLFAELPRGKDWSQTSITIKESASLVGFDLLLLILSPLELYRIEADPIEQGEKRMIAAGKYMIEESPRS